ncbi:riboflavin biosynthesis protein RibF [Barnesiella sp. An55]|uniref:riboflavin biosynthesis protein RibF n=1 Tax=Barnesiella sp. An55 TaxID=1965646 RepID=UPI000B39E5FB|nr:riboflavin biosynthesis protein RibF [Barnesiella sp. An55]OUN73210.1 riboflavin biosynthesis protein RibF [Barnesiella sp. An55]HIZ25441.1 riboflavin biosynthesis protein RibF [Candidatus Barnesiella merdipullorum]
MTAVPHETSTTRPLFAALGVFDGVHRGHRAVIARVEAEAAARRLDSAVISFRTHPQQVLHPEVPFRMLTSPQEREALLRQTGIDRVVFLDFTREMSQLSAFEFLQILSSQLQVKGLIIGYDHRFGHNRAEGFDDYVRYGQQLGMEILHADELVTDDGPVSSSIIRKLLLQGDLTTANRLLSYPYTLHGKVVNGFHVGRELGFPTANIDMDYPDKLIPANGVYAVHIVLGDGRRYGGMLNIGNRPTLNRPNDYSIEANIFDFSGNLYGENLAVELVQYIRPERTFANTEALRTQLVADEAAIRKILV